MSSSLKLQKRLSSSILKCGKSKVWMDPNEINEIAMANSRKNIRKLIKDGFILKKPPVMHSRARARREKEARAKGRHSGPGKRRGTANARNPTKLIWIRRIRVLRRLLRKYRAQKKIDRHLYHELYLKAKGNVFKSKRVLQEYIFKTKSEKLRTKSIEDQAQAHRDRTKQARKIKGKSTVESLRTAADDSAKSATKKTVKKTATTTPVAKPTTAAKTTPTTKAATTTKGKTTAPAKTATKTATATTKTATATTKPATKKEATPTTPTTAAAKKETTPTTAAKKETTTTTAKKEAPKTASTKTSAKTAKKPAATKTATTKK
jgi:large subunit ribosomal protein L19e